MDRDWVYGDRKVLRKKYKNDKGLYKAHKDQLRHDTGQNFLAKIMKFVLDIMKVLIVTIQFLAKLWYFWDKSFCN